MTAGSAPSKDVIVINLFMSREENLARLRALRDRTSPEAISLRQDMRLAEDEIKVLTGRSNLRCALNLAGRVYDEHCRRAEAARLECAHLEAWLHEPTQADKAPSGSVYAFSAGLPGHGRRRR